MSHLKFGTDGVRGVANLTLTPELAFKIGRAAGRLLVESGNVKRALVCRDTRKSGPMIAAGLSSGLCSTGVDVETLGVFPTGGACHLTRCGEYGLGAVVSASHNPAPDNGIKLIGPDARKLSSEDEKWIESQLDTPLADPPIGAAVGDLKPMATAHAVYREWLMKVVPERLHGLTIAMDCGHGAAYEIAPEVFRGLGATVHAVGTSPDGSNINAEGGATKPQTIQNWTCETRSDIGIAFDGDADRAVFCDSQGRLINGDRTMGLWCAHWKPYDRLSPAVVVGTVMSNGGFETFLKSLGVSVERTDVGDKHVSARLSELGGKIGGEQSGHIIFPDLLPTGDGLVTALEICRVLKRDGRPSTCFVDDYENWPQCLVNVAVTNKDGWDSDPRLMDSIQSVEADLAGHGRVNVRASGTQPMIRIMVEADSVELRDKARDFLVDEFLGVLGGKIYSQVDLTHALGD